MLKKLCYLLLAVVCIYPVFALANQTQYLVIEGSKLAGKGKFNNVQINQFGKLQLTSKVKQIFDTKNLLVQSAVSTQKGIFFGTSQEAQLFFYDFKTKKTQELYTGKGLSISAIASNKNTVYFVENPSNKLYKVNLEDKKHKIKLVSQFKDVNYVWGMQYLDKKLYVITGGEAVLYSLDLQQKENKMSKPVVVFKTQDEEHFMTLTLKKDYAYLGGHGSGGLYQVRLKDGKVKNLYHTYEGEVSDIFVENSSSIYFTTSAAEAKPVGKDFDYTDAFQKQDLTYQLSMAKLAQKLDKEKQAEILGQANNLTVKNSLYHYTPSKMNKLFTLDQMTLNTLIKKNGDIFIGASGGRLFRYEENTRFLSLLSTLNQEDIVKLEFHKGLLYGLTSNLGSLYEITPRLNSDGEFISEIIPLGGSSQLGKFTVRASNENQGKVEAFVRGGQTKVIDKNWTDWEGPFDTSNTQRSKLKNLQYVQYKVHITGKENQTPSFLRLINPYIAMNKQPSISFFTAYYDRKNLSIPYYMLNINWKAVDGDGDPLLYNLSVKDKDGVEWSKILNDYATDKFILDTRILPDGVYHFQLEASDKINTSMENKANKKQISNAIIIDNTPPDIKIKSVTNDNKGNIIIKGLSEDKTSFIAKNYYRLNLQENWSFIDSDTGIYDEKAINFSLKIPKKKLKNLENTVFLRTFDINFNQKTIKIKLDGNGKKLS